jgi:hypothetical protein
MTRTQIQFTEEQYQALKEEAHRQKVSLAEAVRGAVDLWLAQRERTRRARRSLASLGRFRSGLSDVAERHDAYLTETYRGSGSD